MMTWSLQLRNGDLALSGAQFGTVTNENKLIQDLRCHILEHMGTDNAHPGFGSLIDGGVTPEGQAVTGVIGEEHIDLVVIAIEAEIQRIIKEHQAKQLSRAKSDRYLYAKSTMTPREVLLGIANIQITQREDRLNVKVTVQTATGSVLDLDFPLDAEGQLNFNTDVL